LAFFLGRAATVVEIPTMRSGGGTRLAAYRDQLFGGCMERLVQWRRKQEGKLGYILLWALGVPIPVLFVIFLLRGCT
jgi:hypothetical protein